MKIYESCIMEVISWLYNMQVPLYENDKKV